MGVRGANLGAGVPVGVSGVKGGTGVPPGGTRADVGIGGGAAPLRPVTGPAATGPFAAAAAGGGLRGSAGAWLETDGAPAAPSRSNDNPEGGGPELDTGEDEESKFRARGGWPPVAGGCCASDISSTNPSGGVLLEALSEPGGAFGRE
jgi:hypothetical protein